jgi:hypothetical protein
VDRLQGTRNWKENLDPIPQGAMEKESLSGLPDALYILNTICVHVFIFSPLNIGYLICLYNNNNSYLPKLSVHPDLTYTAQAAAGGGKKIRVMEKLAWQLITTTTTSNTQPISRFGPKRQL